MSGAVFSVAAFVDCEGLRARMIRTVGHWVELLTDINNAVEMLDHLSCLGIAIHAMQEITYKLSITKCINGDSTGD